MKHAVSGSAVIYVRPIQSNLDMTPSLATRSGETVYSQCVGCQKMVALFEMKQHTQACNQGETGKFSKHTNAINPATSQAESTCESPVLTEPIVVNEKCNNDLQYLDDDNTLFPSSDVKANWTDKLQTMLPDMPKLNIESAVNVSVPLEEAASIVCDGIHVIHLQVPKNDQKSWTKKKTYQIYLLN